MSRPAPVWGARFVLPQRHSPSLHELVHKELDLSKEQKEKIAMLEGQFAARRQAREEQLHAANAELAAAINERHEYSPEVRTAVAHFDKAMGELQKKTVEHCPPIAPGKQPLRNILGVDEIMLTSVLILTYFEETSQQAAAEFLGTTVKAVDTRLDRARLKLAPF